MFSSARRRNARLDRLYRERDVLYAQLEAVEAEEAWLMLGDDPLEIAEGEEWRGHVEAMRRAVRDIERQIADLERSVKSSNDQRQ